MDTPRNLGHRFGGPTIQRSREGLISSSWMDTFRSTTCLSNQARWQRVEPEQLLPFPKPPLTATSCCIAEGSCFLPGRGGAVRAASHVYQAASMYRGEHVGSLIRVGHSKMSGMGLRHQPAVTDHFPPTIRHHCKDKTPPAISMA